MTALPEWMPMPEWESFVAMRKKIKKPMTDGAVERMIKKLDGFRAEGENLAAVLNQSEDKCWLDVFPVKQPDRRQAARSGPDMSRLGKAGQATANNALEWLEGN